MRPHESRAAVNLFFQNMATEAVTVVALQLGQRTYVTALPAGVYYAYTWLPPEFSQKAALRPVGWTNRAPTTLSGPSPSP